MPASPSAASSGTRSTLRTWQERCLTTATPPPRTSSANTPGSRRSPWSSATGSTPSAAGRPSSRLQTARELGEHLLSLAQQVGDTALLLEAHCALGNTLNYLGEFAATPGPLCAGDRPLRPSAAPCPRLPLRAGPGVVCRVYAAVTLWLLGYPDQALQRSHEALTLAGSSRTPSAWPTLCSLPLCCISSAGSHA